MTALMVAISNLLLEDAVNVYALDTPAVEGVKQVLAVVYFLEWL